MARLTFLGHAAALLEAGGRNVLVDPFLSGNPQAPKDYRLPHVDYILLSHFHGDHLGDTVAIAKEHGATVISTYEIAVHLAEQEGLDTRPMHIGGKAALDFGSVRIVAAVHGSGIAGGLACGFVVGAEGRNVYFACDTALFGDMRLIGERYGPIDVALLPIGSNFTMDVDDAVAAALLVRPKVVVPIHYNTFPLIAADPAPMVAPLGEAGIEVRILSPGETLAL